MAKLLVLGCVAFVLFIILDLLWFQVAGNFFKGQVGSIARLTESGEWNIRYVPALLAYILMALGVVMFVLPQSASTGSAVFFGAALGLIGFGLYDLTNLATLTAWTVPFAVVDMSWGTCVTSLVSGLLYSASKFTFFT